MFVFAWRNSEKIYKKLIKIMIWPGMHRNRDWVVNWKKKIQNLKFENYVLFRGFSMDLSLEGSLSDGSEELPQRGWGGYIGVLQHKPGS